LLEAALIRLDQLHLSPRAIDLSMICPTLAVQMKRLGVVVPGAHKFVDRLF